MLVLSTSLGVKGGSFAKKYAGYGQGGAEREPCLLEEDCLEGYRARIQFGRDCHALCKLAAKRKSREDLREVLAVRRKSQGACETGLQTYWTKETRRTLGAFGFQLKGMFCGLCIPIAAPSKSGML